MHKFLCLFPTSLFLACLLGSYSSVSAQTAAVENSPESQEVHALGDNFVKAFNAHDAAQLAALWKEDASYVSAGESEKLTGRKEIEAAYAKLFQSDPKVQIASRAQATQTVEAAGITLSGILDEKHSDGSLTSSYFQAKCVLENGKWLIASVEESPFAPAMPATVQLEKLKWFQGRWEDKQDHETIRTVIVPAPGGTFLTRRYQRYTDDEPVQGGMQMIGWDQEQQCFRTWLFDEDGSFGEGYFTQTDDAEWSVKLAMKLPDGRRGALTQVIQIVSEDELKIQNVDQQLDGAPLPNSPVATLKRLPANTTGMK